MNKATIIILVVCFTLLLGAVTVVAGPVEPVDLVPVALVPFIVLEVNHDDHRDFRCWEWLWKPPWCLEQLNQFSPSD